MWFEYPYYTEIPLETTIMKVLLLENIDQIAAEFFTDKGYLVKTYPKALSEEELQGAIKQVSILGIRSKTKITKAVLDRAKNLQAIGAFCIGTDQINIASCQERGIAVFNAPFSNTRSVAELAIGGMIMLFRGVVDKSLKMHGGMWQKSAQGSFEIRGKTLGIIGYGNIGSQLSILAELMGMQVLYYDIFDRQGLGNAHKCQSLEEVLRESDVVSLHVDGRKENSRLLGKEEFSQMKKGAFFLNLSRGKVVDIDALAEAIKNEHLAGAAVDVFPLEPAKNGVGFVSPLQNLQNVILTPHIGGSTVEAQIDIARFVSKKLHERVVWRTN